MMSPTNGMHEELNTPQKDEFLRGLLHWLKLLRDRPVEQIQPLIKAINVAFAKEGQPAADLMMKFETGNWQPRVALIKTRMARTRTRSKGTQDG